METNKYYTPNIEDFYPGYIFEYKPKQYLQIQTNEASMKIFEKMGIKSSEFDDIWNKSIFNEIHLLSESEKLEDIMWSMSIKQYQGPSNFWDISNRIKKEAIRTKYLDKEDIEKCGWNFKELKDHVREIYSFISNNHIFTLFKFINDYIIEILVDYRDEQFIFQGECKSINELKKIMNWLNIK